MANVPGFGPGEVGSIPSGAAYLAKNSILRHTYMEHNRRCNDCGEPIIRLYPDPVYKSGLCYLCSESDRGKTKEMTKGESTPTPSRDMSNLIDELGTILEKKAKEKRSEGAKDPIEPSMVNPTQNQPVGVQFEYKVKSVNGYRFKRREEILNELGADGWKLQTVDSNCMYLFRPKKG